MMIKYKIHKLEFSKEEIFKIFGKVKNNKYDFDELHKKKMQQINKILREEMEVKECSTWKKTEKIIVIMWGFPKKCNHFKQLKNDNDEFVGFKICKKSPSRNDDGENNGRCELKGGHLPSTSKRKKGGRTSEDMMGNDHRLVNGLHSKGNSLPDGFKERLKVKKQQSLLDKHRERYDFLVTMAEFLAEEKGIQYVSGGDEFIVESEISSEVKEKSYNEENESYVETITKDKKKVKDNKLVPIGDYLAIDKEIDKLAKTIAELEKTLGEDTKEELIFGSYDDFHGDE